MMRILLALVLALLASPSWGASTSVNLTFDGPVVSGGGPVVSGSGPVVSGSGPVVSGTCPKGSSYADGCAGAPSGTPQVAGLLTTYGVNRPPWNVAGVDYAVGITPGTTLVSWQTLGAAQGIQLNGNQIRCAAVNSVVNLNGIDFTAAGGAVFYNSPNWCASVTITNSKFGSPDGVSACANGSTSSYYVIQNEANIPLVLKNDSFAMGACLFGQASLVDTAGSLVFEYNYIDHFQAQVIQAGTTTAPVTYEFNLIEDCCYNTYGGHMNFQEFGGEANANPDLVQFNTVYMLASSPGAGEVFQFYGNSPGGTMASPSVTNNTIVTQDPGQCQSNETGCAVSYALHGSDQVEGGGNTALSGTPLIENNYFDPSGMYGPFYGSSFTGWTASGNINMKTGAAVTPSGATP
jgi:large repetitive protein